MGHPVTITSGDGFELAGYRADPGGQPRGGIVVVQEVFGVNGHIRSVCDRYAAAGYVAVAPAIFDRIQRDVELGYGPEDITIGVGIARGKLQLDDVVADVAAAGRSLGQLGKVGIVGYCFGGMVTALCAIRCGEVFAAAASYYGGNTPALADQTPVVPMIMHFGERDHAIPIADVRRLATTWPHVTVHVYDAEHGFNCDQRASYDPAAAALAEERTLEHFAEHVG